MKPTIALFMSNPAADTACCNGMLEALGDYYKFQIFGAKTIGEVNFNKIKLVAFPGGTGDADLFDKLINKQKQVIVDYVKDGGHYLGICMGAYWAGKHYFNLVNNVAIEQYIHRPQAEIKRSFETTIDVRWQRKNTRMFFFDGCAFIGKGFKTIARYQNGDAMAIIKNRIGLIGCHPESRKSWYARPYLKQHWHDFEHHVLLQEFVDQLIKD